MKKYIDLAFIFINSVKVEMVTRLGGGDSPALPDLVRSGNYIIITHSWLSVLVLTAALDCRDSVGSENTWKPLRKQKMVDGVGVYEAYRTRWFIRGHP
jgi:hypothetical protein